MKLGWTTGGALGAGEPFEAAFFTVPHAKRSTRTPTSDKESAPRRGWRMFYLRDNPTVLHSSYSGAVTLLPWLRPGRIEARGDLVRLGTSSAEACVGPASRGIFA